MKRAFWFGLPFLLANACVGTVEGPERANPPAGAGSGSGGSTAATGGSTAAAGAGGSGAAAGSGGSTAATGGSSGAMTSGGSAGETGGSSGSGGQVTIDDILGVDPETLSDGIPPHSRVLRLTHAEYDLTASDLLGLDVDRARNFPEEQPSLGPYEGLAGLAVNERLLKELDRAAEELAAEVVATPSAYAGVVGCDPVADGCRDTFISGFGTRAFRRPLEQAEADRYRTLFDSAGELTQSGDPFRDGVELVVEAMLRSPKFLYRIERGGGSDAAGVLLRDHEVATRLSYMLLGTMPDSALFAAAAAGTLTTSAGIAEQAARLTSDARFVERVLDFHERWMQLDELNSIAKDPATFSSFSPALIASMRAETRRFIEEITLTRGGTVASLLTSPSGFVDQNLAQLYGLSGSFGADLSEVSHDPASGRLGLFTQASFLAGHSSSSTGTSPILRGVFLLRRLACVEIDDPPAGAQMQEPAQAPAEEIRTTREYFTWKTSMPTCAGCHSLINPTGFAFEEFDGIGRHRTTENGAAVDTTGLLAVGDEEIEFSGAADLLQGLSELARVRACYAKNWLEFAYGRAQTSADLRALGLATRDTEDATYSIRDLATSLTERPAFFHLPLIAE
jgi:hypothetical protein